MPHFPVKTLDLTPGGALGSHVWRNDTWRNLMEPYLTWWLNNAPRLYAPIPGKIFVGTLWSPSDMRTEQCSLVYATFLSKNLGPTPGGALGSHIWHNYTWRNLMEPYLTWWPNNTPRLMPQYLVKFSIHTRRNLMELHLSWQRNNAPRLMPQFPAKTWDLYLAEPVGAVSNLMTKINNAPSLTCRF